MSARYFKTADGKTPTCFWKFEGEQASCRLQDDTEWTPSICKVEEMDTTTSEIIEVTEAEAEP